MNLNKVRQRFGNLFIGPKGMGGDLVEKNDTPFLKFKQNFIKVSTIHLIGFGDYSRPALVLTVVFT